MIFDSSDFKNSRKKKKEKSNKKTMKMNCDQKFAAKILLK